MKKFLKDFLWIVLGLILILTLLLYITDNTYVFKGIGLVYLKGHTTANIHDSEDFDNDTIKAPILKTHLPHDSLYNRVALTPTLINELSTYKTTAFLVLKDGKIIQEQYWETDSTTLSNSFSMAKTITTLLVQKAIEDGLIQSWEEPITQYIPQYKNDKLAQQCTLGDLSRMTSGFQWKEDYYFPINPTAKAYYDNDMDAVMLTRRFVEKPGTHFQYLSGNTQLLGYALKNSLHGKTIAQYLSEKFWQPMGMEENALWTVDHPGGIEKTYCCIHATAQNFSKFGLLMLNNGNWNGNQLINASFVTKMHTPHPLSDGHYGYGTWTENRYSPNFYFMRGHLGQYVIVVPQHKIVIVRLGEKRDNSPYIYSDHYYPNEIYIYVDETINALKQAHLIP